MTVRNAVDIPGTDLLRPLASRSSFSCHPCHRERSPRQSASQNGRWWRLNLGILQESRWPGWHWSLAGRLYEEASQYKQRYQKYQGKFVLLSCTRSRHRLLPRVRRCGATAESLVPKLSQTSQNARIIGAVSPPPPPFFLVHYPLSTHCGLKSRKQNQPQFSKVLLIAFYPKMTVINIVSCGSFVLFLL